MTTLIVLAKEPRPGHSKTRLCPPLSPQEAAEVAEAALRTTLDAAAATSADRLVVALDGAPGDWVPDGAEVIPQRQAGHAARIAGAFADTGGPALLIGMDSPQARAEMLDAALAELRNPGLDAVLGPAEDGGWWAIGLQRPDDRVFAGVPMSRADTCVHQRERLRRLGYQTEFLPTLRDVDTYTDALAVAQLCPDTPFGLRVNGALVR